MKPIRVTSPDLILDMPLRMVAAGAGSTVPITLWVLSEATYAPSNFPWFRVQESDLIWDWDKKESNHKSLRQAGLVATANRGWVIDVRRWVSAPALTAPLLRLVSESPLESGYGDGMTMGPLEACGADIDAIQSDIGSGMLRITKLYAELPREALGTDLTLDYSQVQQGTEDDELSAMKSVGTPPPCPIDPPCPDVSKPKTDAGGCACSTSGEADASRVPFGALLSLGFALARRRKKAVVGRAISP